MRYVDRRRSRSEQETFASRFSQLLTDIYIHIFGLSLGFGVWDGDLVFVCRREIAVVVAAAARERQTPSQSAVYSVCSRISKRILTEPSSKQQAVSSALPRLTFCYVTGYDLLGLHFYIQTYVLPSLLPPLPSITLLTKCW